MKMNCFRAARVARSEVFYSSIALVTFRQLGSWSNLAGGNNSEIIKVCASSSRIHRRDDLPKRALRLDSDQISGNN